MFVYMLSFLAFGSEIQYIHVFSRASWSAKPERKGCKSHQIEQITIHHTAVKQNISNSRQRMRSYQRYHQSKGWMDIAYHYLIDSEGNIFTGRRVDCVGDTGTNYDPTGHFLIVLDGDFEVEEPSKAAKDALLKLLIYTTQRYNISSYNIRGHKEVAATSCPGVKLYGDIPRLKGLLLQNHAKYEMKQYIDD